MPRLMSSPFHRPRPVTPAISRPSSSSSSSSLSSNHHLRRRRRRDCGKEPAATRAVWTAGGPHFVLLLSLLLLYVFYYNKGYGYDEQLKSSDSQTAAGRRQRGGDVEAVVGDAEKRKAAGGAQSNHTPPPPPASSSSSLRGQDDGGGGGLGGYFVDREGVGENESDRSEKSPSSLSSAFSVGTFEVAGVDLAKYRRGITPLRNERKVEGYEPFRLHLDFYIGRDVLDLNTYDDLVRYRAGGRGGATADSSSKDLRFYVDKVAQKRWLPTIGVDVPKPFFVRYASELTENESGNVEDISAAIGALMASSGIGGGDYAAKPSHQTYCDGVRLVAVSNRTDARTGTGDDGEEEERGRGKGSSAVVYVAKNHGGFEAARKDADAVRDEVSARLADYLGMKSREGVDSRALRDVKPGLVVEERFESWWDDGDDDVSGGGSGGGGGAESDHRQRPVHAMEFKVHCVWGRAVFAAWHRGTKTRLGTVRRDGTLLPGGGAGAGDDDVSKKLPAYVDWDRVVHLAESLSAHKDFYRVDVFVGLPAGSGGLKSAKTDEDRRRVVRYVVAETEIAPSTDRKTDAAVLAETARLWIAGYMIGNIEVAKNDEVPKYFHKHGKMPRHPFVTFSVPRFDVAGVDLATYKAGSEKVLVRSEDAAPFELFDDFNIQDKINGNESWRDLIDIRQNLERPSLRFYMDKISQKRWLPTIGVDIPKSILLRYRSELSRNRTVEEEYASLIRIFPTDGDYCAKPSHTSYSDGVRLVKYNESTGRMYVTMNRNKMEAIPPELEKDWREGMARRLAEYLHKRPRQNDSWALHHVKPGVIIEERFTAWDRDDRGALEFKCFTVWGRFVFALWRRGSERPGLVYRNGTLIDWSERKDEYKTLPGWLDWKRVVELSERLAVHKDMYRVDVFVGVAAGSAVLRPGVSEEDRMGAVRYVCSETEIYPTTSVDDEVFAETARLWIAGYRAGNFRVVPNSEVPKEFLKKGYMPMKEQSDATSTAN